MLLQLQIVSLYFGFPFLAILQHFVKPNNEYLAVSSEEFDNELQVIEINTEGKPVRR
jgi:hypothetical protein